MKTFKSLRLSVPGAPEKVEQTKIAIKLLKIAGLLALLVIVLLFPQQISPDEATTTIAVYTLMFAAWATAWNIFSGYTGYIALGHATFFGTGAYALGIMCQRWNIGSSDISFLFLRIEAGYTPFLLLPFTGLITGLIAVPLGWIALRTRRHTFIVITIAIFFIFQLLAFNLRKITNGSTGLGFPNPPWVYPFYNFPFYYVMLAILLLALGVSWWIRHSKYGLGLLAIRDDEDRALGLGVKTGPFKLVAFVISAIFAGMLGGVWGYFVNSVFPQFAFDPLNDITLALTAFMGGLGTLAGPIIGALIIEWARFNFETLPFIQRTDDPAGYYLILYGALFLVIILLLPEGIVPTLGKWRARWHAWRANRNGASRVTDAAEQAEAVAVKPNEAGEGVNR